SSAANPSSVDSEGCGWTSGCGGLARSHSASNSSIGSAEVAAVSGAAGADASLATVSSAFTSSVMAHTHTAYQPHPLTGHLIANQGGYDTSRCRASVVHPKEHQLRF